MSTSTVPQASALFASLSHAEKCYAVQDLFAPAAPSFDPATYDDAGLSGIIDAWLAGGSIPPAMLSLSCACVIAARAPVLPAAPVFPAAPAAPVIVPPTFAPAATPLHDAMVANVAAPDGGPVIASMAGARGAVNRAALAAESAAATVAPVVVLDEVSTFPVNATAAAPVAPAPAATVPQPDLTAPGMVNARSLFADCPQSVIDAIPATLRVYYAAHVDAPAIDPAYAFNASNLAQTLCAAACTPAFNTWCAGPRGTGKTEYVRQIAARMGRPFFRVNFNRSTDAEDILGSLGIAEGETRFVYGPVALAIQTPHAILLLDEPTYAAPAHIAALNPVLERDGAMVRMPRTGERLAVAEGIMIFAADNTAGSGSTSNEYMGRNPFGSDTLDRFGLFLSFDYMPADMERKVVRTMVQRACGIKPASAMVKDVCRLVGTARAKADLGELEGAPSLRRAVAFCVALVQGIDAKEAYTSCIVNAAPEDSQEALRQIYAATWAHDAAAAAAPANPFAVNEGV